MLAAIHHAGHEVAGRVPRASDRALARIDLSGRPIQPIMRTSFGELAAALQHHRDLAP